MNKIYSMVWSRARGMMVVASELASGSGKSAGGRRRPLAAAGSAVALLLALPLVPISAAQAQSAPASCLYQISGTQGAAPEPAPMAVEPNAVAMVV